MDDKKPHGRGYFRHSAMVPEAARRARTAAAIVHGHARVTEIFYTMSNLTILWGELFIQDKAHSRKAEPYNKNET